MSQDGDADDEGATAATGDERVGRRKRPDAQLGSLTTAHPITQPTQTQPDDFAPPTLERGASRLDDICPGLMEHLRPPSSFCSENKLVLITMLRTFVTNARPRARSATDLLIDMVGKEVGLASHRAARARGWPVSGNGYSRRDASGDLFAFLQPGQGGRDVGSGYVFRRV